MQTPPVDASVEAYLAALPAEHRPLYDRVEALVREIAPEAEQRLSYGLPTFVLDGRRLHLGVWKHGVSLYGLTPERDGGFSERYPRLRTGRGTLRLTAQDVEEVGDDELRALVRTALVD